MEQYFGYIISGVITLIIHLALKYVNPKSRLVYWQSHYFEFHVPLPNAEPPSPQTGILITHALTIQNIGTKPSDNIEIVHDSEPDFYKLFPALDYVQSKTPSGEYIVRVPRLAPQEFFSIEFLSYTHMPRLLYVRSENGHAKFIHIQPQQVRSKALLALVQILILVGSFVLAYMLYRIIVFLATHA